MHPCHRTANTMHSLLLLCALIPVSWAAVSVSGGDVLQFIKPYLKYRLIGKNTNQFSYASNAYSGVDLIAGQTLLSTTNKPTLVISNSLFTLRNDSMLVFEAALQSQMELVKITPPNKVEGFCSNFFFGSPMFGVVSTTDDWQFQFYTTNEMIYAVMGYYPPAAMASNSTLANFLYAVPVAERCATQPAILAITMRLRSQKVDWYVDGVRKMSIRQPATALIAGKFKFAQKPGDRLPGDSFPLSVRTVLANIDVRNFFGDGVGRPWTACQCAMISCPNPSPLRTVSVNCNYNKAPALGSYNTEMTTRIYYTLVASILEGTVSVGDIRCRRQVPMDYNWFFAQNQALHETVPRVLCSEPHCSASSSSSACSSSTSSSSSSCGCDSSSSSSCGLPEYIGCPARWRVPQGEQPQG